MKFTKAIIFPATAKFAPALVLALVACSVTFAQDVRTNYMPGTDWSKYHTYAWVDEVQGIPSVGGRPDQILDSQVKQAIDSQMAGKGLTKVVEGGKPDLFLATSSQSIRRSRSTASPPAWVVGAAWEAGPMGGRPRFIFVEYFKQLHRDFRRWYV